MADREEEEEVVPTKKKICGRCGNLITSRVARSINKILHCGECFKKAKEAES